MRIKKFEQYEIKEGIDPTTFDDEQKEAWADLNASDLSVLNDRDFTYYADKLGVHVEDLMGYIADAGLMKSSEDEIREEELRNEIQSKIIDNPDVDNVNVIIKLEELAEELYLSDDIDWEADYEDLLDELRELHKEMTYNPNQMEISFESKIMKFEAFINESSDMMPGESGKYKFKVTGYRTWDEARPEGIVQADSEEEVKQNFSSYDFLKKQDPSFEGADLETIEQIPNNI